MWDLTMVMLANAGFVQISEVCKLACNDVEYIEDQIVLIIISMV